jgi:outer membrane lipoprotein-sorting protein
MTRALLLTAAAIVALLVVAGRSTHVSAAEDLFARSRAMYASLGSYADTGTIDSEFGPAGGLVHERHTFTTRYRGPRHFYFDFVKQDNADRFVVWSDDEAFHSWWQATGVADTYPKGEGASAFINGSVPTMGSVSEIAALLFPQAGLGSTLTELGDLAPAGTESVGGQATQKLVGVARSVYKGTGHETNVRKTTVWIDPETLLIRKVFEDAPGGGQISRITTTFVPQANPTLDDSRFRFTPPASQD